MEKSKNLFIKIDEFIFHKIDLLKNDGSFQKVNDLLLGIDEERQKALVQIIAFFFLLIPYLFVFFFWWGNHNMHKTVEVKTQILEQIATLNGNKGALINISSNYVAPSAILGKEDLDNKMRNIMSQSNIDQAKVHVTNFNQISTSNNISKIEAVLNFNNFGTQDFSNFMRSLVEQEKFKIMRVNLTKNTTNNLLQGELSLMHLGKNAGI